MSSQRPVEDWPGYAVRADGTVWSCRTSHGAIVDEWHQLKPRPDRDGYLSVTLCSPGRRKTIKVAHLVLAAFVGPRPAGAESCHWPNLDPGDNRLENLRWATHHENILDKVRGGTVARGERHGQARLSPKEVAAIRRLFRPGARNGKPPSNASALGRRFGVAPAHIHAIVKGRFWKEAPCS